MDGHSTRAMEQASPHFDGASGLERPQRGAASAVDLTDFARIFSDHGAYVFGLLRRLGVAEADLDDVAQEVFLVVHRALPRFEGRSSLKTWIVGICLRVVSKHRRTLRRRREVPAAPGEESAVDANQAAALERATLGESLEQALAQLPEKQLMVVVLFEIEELSMNEVAAAMGCSRFTAYTRLYAARRKLKRWLSERGVLP